MARLPRSATLAVLALILTAPGFAQARLDGLALWGDRASVLLTSLEIQAWGRLTDDAARREFIDDFWERHDPTPEAPGNPLRDLFERRSAAIDESFADEPGAPYETDRGRVFLVYGPPRAQQMRRTGLLDESLPDDAAEIVWRFDEGNPFLSEFSEIRFVSSDGVAFDLDATLSLGMDPFLASLIEEEQKRLAAGVIGRRTGPPETEPQPAGEWLEGGPDDAAAEDPAQSPVITEGDPSAAEPGEAAGVPVAPEIVDPTSYLSPELLILRETVQGAEPRDDLLVDARFFSFPAPDGNTFTAVAFEVGFEGLTFELPPPPVLVDEADAAEETELEIPEASLQVFGAVLEATDAGERILYRFDIPFGIDETEEEDGRTATHSFGATLTPAQYRMVWGVMDLASGRVTTRVDTLDVPHFGSGELTLSTVLVGRGVEAQMDAARVDRVYSGVRLGNLVVHDDIERVFERDGVIELLYIVAGFGTDSTTMKPHLEVDYRIVGPQGRRGVVRLPTQTMDMFAIGQQIPLAQVRNLEPGGQYGVEIAVRDLVTGGEVWSVVPFRIRAGDTDES